MQNSVKPDQTVASLFGLLVSKFRVNMLQMYHMAHILFTKN